MDLSQFSAFTPEMIKSIHPTIPQPLPPAVVEESRQLYESVAENLAEEAGLREAYQKAHLEAVQTTAAETKVIREKQDKIIDNQQALIEYQKAQIRALSEQLVYLQEIFSSEEKGTEAQKEILQMLIDQENDKHPIRDYLADKGGDIGVAAVTAVGTVFWPVIKTWLISKGINIP